MKFDEQELQRRRELIDAALTSHGLTVQSWDRDTDGNIRANLGRFRVLEDDDEGLLSGTEGEVKASVVGAAEYGNRHVAFYFYEDDMDPDAGVRINDLSMQVEGI